MNNDLELNPISMQDAQSMRSAQPNSSQIVINQIMQHIPSNQVPSADFYVGSSQNHNNIMRIMTNRSINFP